jgi:biopolymer transport protein TolQ
MPILTAVFVYLLQSDSGAVPAAPSGITGFGALADLVGNIGTIAVFVLLLLLAASIYSWTVILGKISTFSKATRRQPQGLSAPSARPPKLQEIAALATECASQPPGAGL